MSHPALELGSCYAGGLEVLLVVGAEQISRLLFLLVPVPGGRPDGHDAEQVVLPAAAGGAVAAAAGGALEEEAVAAENEEDEDGEEESDEAPPPPPSDQEGWEEGAGRGEVVDLPPAAGTRRNRPS